MAKVYVTKYALTGGIKIMETSSDITKIGIRANDSSGYISYFHGNDWHTTAEKADARAEEMRLRKIASLEKALERMRSLAFPLTAAEA